MGNWYVRWSDAAVQYGAVVGNTIYLDSAESEVRFPVFYANGSDTSYNVTNGFVVYSDADGVPGNGLPGSRSTGTARWGFHSYDGGNYKVGSQSGPSIGLWVDTTGYFPKSDFDSIFRFDCYRCDGLLIDTLMLTGVGSHSSGIGLRPRDSGVMFVIRILAKAVDTGKWICVDSITHNRTINKWKWPSLACADTACGDQFPAWSGPKCFVIRSSSDPAGRIANRIPRLESRPEQKTTYDFNTTGIPQAGVRWHVSSGPAG